MASQELNGRLAGSRVVSLVRLPEEMCIEAASKVSNVMLSSKLGRLQSHRPDATSCFFARMRRLQHEPMLLPRSPMPVDMALPMPDYLLNGAALLQETSALQHAYHIIA